MPNTRFVPLAGGFHLPYGATSDIAPRSGCCLNKRGLA